MISRWIYTGLAWKVPVGTENVNRNGRLISDRRDCRSPCRKFLAPLKEFIIAYMRLTRAVGNYHLHLFCHLQHKAAIGEQRTFSGSHEYTCPVWNPVAEAHDQWIRSNRVSSHMLHRCKNLSLILL